MFMKRKAWQTLITSNQSQSVYQLERQWPLLAHMYVYNYEHTDASNWEIFYKNSWPAIFKSDKFKKKMRELFHAETGNDANWTVLTTPSASYEINRTMDTTYAECGTESVWMSCFDNCTVIV